MIVCPNGHGLSHVSGFCPHCGAQMPASPGVGQLGSDPSGSLRTPAERPTSPEPKAHSQRRVGLAAAAVIIVGGVASALVVAYSATASQSASQSRHFTLRLGDDMAGDDCTPHGYTGSYVVGTRATLRDANDAIVATGLISGRGSKVDGGCLWSVTLRNVPKAAAYTLELQLPAGKFDYDRVPVPQDFTYSYEELQRQGWRVTYTKNF